MAELKDGEATEWPERSSRAPTLLKATAAVLLVTLVALMAFGWRALGTAREEARRIRCRNNLHQLAKGMAMYLDWGDNRFYTCPLGRGGDPGGYNGAEWFAALYWTGTVPDPGVFICPSSGDTNHDGADIGSTRTTAAFGSQTVSYAGMHWRSITPTGGAIRDDFPPTEVMASDDTEGTINHGEAGMCVMFFDSHVEWRTADKLDPRTAVGQKGGLLEKLRN